VQHGSRKAIFAALIANLGIAIAKLVGFLLTGAASMLAESVHSLADSGNQALLILGGSRAARKATPEHPFGYGRERYFWAFVVALVLFSFGGLFASYEGFQKLRDPHELESPLIAVGILVFAILIESWSLRTAVLEARAAKGQASWWSFIRHSKSPELPVVLLEDLGAEIGLFLALIGVGLAELTGNARWDALGSLAIGILLIGIAVLLAMAMKSLLVGEGASPADTEAIRTAIEGSADVQRLIHIRTQHIGPEELLVGAKVELDAHLSFAEVVAAVNVTEGRVRAAVPTARVIYIEPDSYSAAAAEAEVTGESQGAPAAH
jgi:cation diffusion facilitator family transporter